MKLTIGLQSENLGWERILKQEGCSYSLISEVAQHPLVIIPALCDKANKEAILEHISDGYVAILEPRAYRKMFNAKFVKRKVRYIIPQKSSYFFNIGLTDFHCDFYDLVKSDISYLDRNFRISIEAYGSGYIILLPFELNSVMLDSGAKRKRFYADRSELPSEIVARVSKGKIRRLISQILGYAHDLIDLPFVRRWYYPSDYKNAFLFRLDTDFCSNEDAKRVYKLCNEHQIKATWFVDTVSTERLKEVYAGFESQEIGLHCFRHKVFSDYRSNYDNLKLGLVALDYAGIKSRGFAAPFGTWNGPLAKVLEELGFDYSSEFSLAYDDLPFYPNVNGELSSVLQIPIHPISIGRLLRSHFSDKEMIEYFKMILKVKLALNEPVLIYYHPHRRKNEVIEHIFSLIDKEKTWLPSFGEYTDWWQKRWNKQQFYIFEDNKLFCETEDGEDYFLIRKNSKETLTKLDSAKSLDEMDWQQVSWANNKETLKMRRFHWRDVLYNLESLKGRIQR